MIRKAQISMSFNWIFILIAGIVFLIFFFSVIGNQTKTSNQKVAAVVVKQFKTILETTTQKAGTFKTYRTSPIDLNFVCDGPKALSYYTVGETYGGTTTYDVIFAPPHLEGREIYTWTQEWSYPFKVMNFLYITNKYHLFIFVKPEGETIISKKISKLEKDFPKNLTISYLNEENIPTLEMNNDRYTYILFASQYVDFISRFWSEGIIKEKSQIIVIQPDISSDIFKSGTIYFLDSKNYRKSPPLKLSLLENSSYYGAPSLYGALFSGEKKSYECNMQKAFNQLNLINKLNTYRIKSFLPEIPVTSNCFYLYNGSLVLGGGMLNLEEDYELQTSNGFFGVNKDALMPLVEDIENKNTRISFEAKCPVLY